MWYILYMNKDVIYIEPEDDITDIIVKIENSKEKIVALVPPKKAGVFRSVVNIKLIAKSGASSGKTVVLVTTDPSIIKLAGASKLPVTKNLQSAPSVPEAEAEDNTSKEDLIEKDDEEAEEPTEENSEKEEEKKAEEEEETAEEEAEEEKEKDEEEDEENEEEEEKPKKKQKSDSKKTKKGLIGWIRSHKKLSILCGIGIILLIIFLIWALFIAPAVNVFVSIKTDSNNFSEVISFVKELSQEDIKEGKVYLEERKIETENEVSFEATGQKNTGEKATGDLVIYSYFSAKGANAINAGTKFTLSGLSFIANENTTLVWDGDSHSCENEKIIVDGKIQCLISGRIKVTAAEPGTKYNIAKSSTGWETVANVAAYSDKEMSGGTDNIIKVVQQSDVEKAKDELNNNKGKESENKEKLYATITEDNLIIESTFSQDTSVATATPAVDEEVKEGVTPTLKTTTTTSVYIIDKIKLEELIREKVDISEDKKIFEIRNVYIDGFKELEGGFTGKLKAVYFTGPKITESELVEKIMGKGIGDARREISDIDGVADVKMDPSYPWVMKVPTDTNRITVEFEIKDQDGNKIEEKTEDKKSEKEDDKKESDSKEEDKKE